MDCSACSHPIARHVVGGGCLECGCRGFIGAAPPAKGKAITRCSECYRRPQGGANHATSCSRLGRGPDLREDMKRRP